MKNTLRLFSVLTAFLFLFGCAQNTEIANEGGDTSTPSSESSLSNLTITGVTLNPAFDPATETYTATVSNDVDSITVSPVSTDGGATITVNGVDVTSGSGVTIPLPVGDTVITVVVTAEDGTTTTYTATVTRAPAPVPPPPPPAPSTDSSLSNLVISDGTLAPTFQSTTLSYTADVDNSVSSITVTPTATDTNATISVNGTAVSSGATSPAIPLSEGDNTVTIVVTAEDGTTTSAYVITVTRASLSNDSFLSNLEISDGALIPVFQSSTLSYTADVDNSIDTITVTPTVSDDKAAITVNGDTVASGTPSPAIALAEGNNTITIIVTAEDGTTTTYVITVNREAALSSDSSLSNLEFSDGVLNPVFSSTNTLYTLTVPGDVFSMTVTPTANDDKATITLEFDGNISDVVSGSAASLNWQPAVVSPVITIVVTAEDGTDSTYSIQIARDTTLSNLVLSDGTLTPAFDSATEVYAATVPNSVASITVTPTLSDANAIVSVNGTPVTSGSPSQAIDLAEGAATLITVVVEAVDTTSTTYEVTVTRSGPLTGFDPTEFPLPLTGSTNGYGQITFDTSGNLLAIPGANDTLFTITHPNANVSQLDVPSISAGQAWTSVVQTVQGFLYLGGDVGRIYQVDPNTGDLIGSGIFLPGTPRINALAYAPAGTYEPYGDHIIAATQSGLFAVNVVGTPAVKTISPTGVYKDIEFKSDGSLYAVTGSFDVYRILPTNGFPEQVTQVPSLSADLSGIAVDSDGNRLFVMNRNGGSVLSIDIASGDYSTIPYTLQGALTPTYPIGMAYADQQLFILSDGGGFLQIELVPVP